MAMTEIDMPGTGIDMGGGNRDMRPGIQDMKVGNLGAGQSVFIYINIYQEWESSFHNVYFSFKINELF